LCREAQEKGCRLSITCDVLGLSARTIERWIKEGMKDRRKGAPKSVPRKLAPEERQKIVTTCCAKEYDGLTPHEIVPALAEKSIYLGSESTFYRVLREAGLMRRAKKTARKASAEPDVLVATTVNQLWSWDISYLKTSVRGSYFYLYLFMDIYSRAIMGWEIHENEDGAKASVLFESLVNRWGAHGVVLRSDNGSPMRSMHMLATLRRLGVVPSFSKPSVSNDNPYSESLFKTIKYTAGYPGSFETIEEARAWMARFAAWYNNKHRHSRIGYVTPMQRHAGHDGAVLAERERTYMLARQRHPERWTRASRSWARIEEVSLRRSNRRSTKNVAA